MEKSRRKVLLGAAPITFLLLFPFLFADLFGENIIIPFDQLIHFSSSQAGEPKSLNSLLSKLVRGEDRRKLETTGFSCDIAENSIVCISNKPVRIDTRSNVTIYSSTQTTQQEIKPYALQKDTYLLQYITPVKILNKNITEQPVCQYNHQVPAVIFSSGLTGNVFHEINDVIIPLFITTKHFESNVLLILEDYSPSFVSKYSKVLSRLSNYDVMDPAANASVHCFPGSIVGLKYHDNLALDPSDIPGGYSMRDFRHFLSEAYDFKFVHVSQIRKPTVLLLSREKTRKFLNEDEIIAMMKGLGFRVIRARAEEASNLNKFVDMVNSCSVLVGAHGAGLTNELFLPADAVMVQVELLGLEWASDHYYGSPARAMDVHYLRYKIKPEESSLVELYGRNHSVVTNPESLYAKGYRAVREVYLDQQDVKVDIVNFRKIMLQALQLVKNGSLTR